MWKLFLQEKKMYKKIKKKSMCKKNKKKNMYKKNYKYFWLSINQLIFLKLDKQKL